MDFETKTVGMDQDLRNYRTDDPFEKAALSGARAVVARAPFDNNDDLKVSVSASEDEISVTVAKA